MGKSTESILHKPYTLLKRKLRPPKDKGCLIRFKGNTCVCTFK